MAVRIVLFLSLLMSLATGLVTYQLCQHQAKKIGVVDAVRVFDQFNMKKELEAGEKAKLQAISKNADSIGNLLQVAKASRKEDDVKKLSYAYAYIKQGLEKEYEQSNRDINAQVWKRLNPIIEQFGKTHNLHLIIGANGMGSVLYNDDYYDMTEEVIKYVNKKYEEGS